MFQPFSGAYPPSDITAQNIAAGYEGRRRSPRGLVLEGLTARHAACNRVIGLSWSVRSGASDKGTLQRLDRGLLIYSPSSRAAADPSGWRSPQVAVDPCTGSASAGSDDVVRCPGGRHRQGGRPPLQAAQAHRVSRLHEPRRWSREPPSADGRDSPEPKHATRPSNTPRPRPAAPPRSRLRSAATPLC